MWKKAALGVSALTIVMGMGTAIPAFASTSGSAGTPVGSSASQVSQQVASQNFQHTVALLQKFLHRNSDGTFRLDLPPGLTKQLSATQLVDTSYNRIISGMMMVNSLISEGKLKSTSSMEVYDPSVTNNFSIQGNLNQLVWQWWGVQIYLNNTNTQKLIWIMAGGAGAVTIGAAVAGMVPGGQILSGVLWIFDGLIGIGGAAIGYNDVNGQGIVIDCTYPVPPLYIPYVWVYSQ